MKAKLVIVGGAAKTNDIELELPAVLGRGRDVSVPLPHPLVSRKHCEIVEQDGRLLVRDLDSLNGTFVGEARVSEAVLPPGGLLTVGTVTFRAVYGDSAGKKPPKSGAPPAARAAVDAKSAAPMPAPAKSNPTLVASDEDSVLEIDSVEEVLDVGDIDEIVDIDDALVEELVEDVVEVADPDEADSAEAVAEQDSAELLDLEEVEIIDQGAMIAGVDDQTERARPPRPPADDDGGHVEFVALAQRQILR